jgi:hypothetical protein
MGLNKTVESECLPVDRSKIQRLDKIDVPKTVGCIKLGQVW